MRAGSGFRVVLDRDDRKRAMAHAFDAAVVEIDMRYFDFGRQAIGMVWDFCEASVLGTESTARPPSTLLGIHPESPSLPSRRRG